MKTKRLLLFAVLTIFANSVGLVLAQTNIWTKPSSGYWEESYWSLGTLPSSSQSILFGNPGYKALGISIVTVNTARSSLTVSNLVISSPEGSFNTLLLNYSGVQNPLRVLGSFYLGTNAQLLNLSGRLTVEGTNGSAFAVDGTVIQAEGGQIEFRQASFGNAGPAMLSITNGLFSGHSLLLGRSYPVTFQQLGGTSIINSVVLNTSASTADLYGGKFMVGSLTINDHSDSFFPTSGNTRFSQWAGDVVVTNGIGMGYFASGTYYLNAGTLTTPSIQLSGTAGTGLFYQAAGSNDCASLGIGSGRDSWGAYYLTNGTLTSKRLSIGGFDLHSSGFFSQYGGVHNADSIWITGYFDDYDGIGSGSYSLSGGLVNSTGISIGIFSGMSQTGGTNKVNGDILVEGTGGYYLESGFLSVSNIATFSRYFPDVGQYGPTITQTGGVALVRGQLLIHENSRYRLLAGALEAPIISLGDSIFTYGGGQIVSNVSFQLGGRSRLELFTSPLSFGALTVNEGASYYYPTNNPIIDFGTNGSTILRFAQSRDTAWTDGATLYIINWSGSLNGGGADRLLIGTNQNGLSARQLSQIVFTNPAGYPSGQYSARILATGEIVPAQQPSISLASIPGSMKLIWAAPFTLQTATNLTLSGIWVDLPNARSPWTNFPSNEPRRFFRLRK